MDKNDTLKYIEEMKLMKQLTRYPEMRETKVDCVTYKEKKWTRQGIVKA